MILDYRADPWAAMRHDVVLADGERIELPIFYADDYLNLIRYYLKDESGAYVVGPDGHPAWSEQRPLIAIVPKSPEEIAAIEGLEREVAEGAGELRVLHETLMDLKYGEGP